MTTIQAVFFGVMLALTPSLVLLAFFLWREGIGVREVGADLEFDDQPPYYRSTGWPTEHFVTSMTAPIASGWSGCRVGFAPTGKRRLCTAHTRNGLSLASLERLHSANVFPAE